MLPLIVPNTPIPPRSRARCFADSPRRGEYGALGTPPGGILLRDPSAAEQNDLNVMFYNRKNHLNHVETYPDSHGRTK